MKKEHWVEKKTLDLQRRRPGLTSGSAINLFFDLTNYFTLITYKIDITIPLNGLLWLLDTIFINLLHIISFIMIINHSMREKEILGWLLGFWQKNGW